MAKTKTAFFCQNCGAQYVKWQGQCTACKSWNTLVEERIATPEAPAWKPAADKKVTVDKPVLVSEVIAQDVYRLNTGDQELNRVLGGGLVPGSLTLLGGEPGIGKSTLLLQIALRLPYKTLYVSGEESKQQIKMRAERIGTDYQNCYLLSQTQTQEIFEQIKVLQPDIVIIDSIQTLQTEVLDSAPGSVGQIRETTAELIRFAKESNTPVLLIGHITKDGTIAGPKILEHMVDTVLQFEGDRHHIYRILRALKNRFGSTAELGIYEMIGSGMREVTNPSELLLSHRDDALSGTAVACALEGMRPIMIEVQSLVSTAVYGTPQRSTTGYNAKRLNMILAVLEKRSGFKLGAKDVFLNITGGLTLEDPAIDLAVVAAVLSSNDDIPLPKNVCFAGEVGLSGEIRPVSRLEQRVQEASKLGFSTIFVSSHSKISATHAGIEIVRVGNIEELATALFG